MHFKTVKIIETKWAWRLSWEFIGQLLLLPGILNKSIRKTWKDGAIHDDMDEISFHLVIATSARRGTR